MSASKGSGHGSGWSGGRGRAAVEGIGHATDGRQPQGACGRQEDEGLQGQQGEPQGRGGLDLDPGLDQQGEQEQHGGLQPGDLRGGEGTEGAERVGEEHGGGQRAVRMHPSCRGEG